MTKIRMYLSMFKSLFSRLLNYTLAQYKITPDRSKIINGIIEEFLEKEGY